MKIEMVFTDKEKMELISLVRDAEEVLNSRGADSRTMTSILVKLEVKRDPELAKRLEDRETYNQLFELVKEEIRDCLEDEAQEHIENMDDDELREYFNLIEENES